MTVPPPITSYNRGFIRVVVESFGYLHGPPAAADITIDLRQVARDPHTTPEMRELTGLEPSIRYHVLESPDVLGVVIALYQLVVAYLPSKDAAGTVVRVSVGCSGGRHRSVVVANELVTRLMASGVGADVEHRDILRPVVTR
jgi:RNase adaptor protein for sRNA GlmZ degradation